ncbi:hypothetical protein ACFPN2_26290 [Steroidobacter flavus]|uniref:Uncharacterized protein n=1 Tax=Steroidobacter flavus TaxID=1842136 RepID=A0ABV8SYG9_9GAMM
MKLLARVASPARLIVVVLMGLFAQAAVAQTAPGSSIRDDVYRDACQLAAPPLQAVCTTLTHLDDQESDVFGFERDDASASAALRLLARLLMEEKQEPQVITTAVVNALDPTGLSFLYCAELRKVLPDGEADVACVRPACLISTDFNSIAKQCWPLTAGRQKDVAKVVRDFLKTKEAETFKCTPTDPKEKDPVCIGAEAAGLVVKVDQTLAFFRAIQKEKLPELAACNKGGDSDKCHEAIVQLLPELARVWSIGTVLSESLRQWPELAPIIDGDGANKFQPAWAEVDKHLPGAADFDEKMAATFPFNLEFVRALRNAQPAVDAANARIAKRLSRVVIEQFQAGKRIAEAVAKVELPADLQLTADQRKRFDDCRAAMAEWAAKSVDLQQVDGGLQLAGFVEANAACKAEAENALFAVARSVAKVETAQACDTGQSITLLKQGFADYCFNAESKKPGVVGLRLKFRPCLDLGDQPCVTVGHLSLLIRATSDSNPLVVDYPLGIKDIQTRVSANAVAVLSVPPQVAYATPDPKLLRESLQRLLPPAFRITSVADAKVDQQLLVTIEGIQIEAVGVKLPLMCAKLGPKRMSFGAAPACNDLRGNIDDLASLAKRKLAKRLEAKLPVLADVPVLLTAAQVLINGTDKCPANGIALSDAAIAPVEQTLALCGTATIDLPGAKALPVAILWQYAGANAQRWRLIVDENKARAALQPLLPNGINIETLSSKDASIVARVTAPGGCRNTVKVDVTKNGVRTNVDEVAAQLGACLVADANLPKLPESFTLFGITFGAEGGGRACATLPDQEQVCISNITMDGDRAVLDKAVLDDKGRLARYLQTNLDAVLPGGVITVREVLPKLKADVAIPALEPLELEIEAAGAQFEQAATAAFQRAATNIVAGTEVNVGPVTVVVKSLAPTKKIEELSLNVAIQYGSESVAAVLQILPSLKLQSPSLGDALVGVIKKFLGNIELPNAKLYLVTTPDGVPLIRCDVELPVIVDALKAGGTIEWRPGKNSEPTFAGPVTLTWAGYTPIFAGVDIGNISGQFDYAKPGDIVLSASLALTSGATTSNILRLTGELTYKKPKTITADTGLFIANSRLARSTTVVDLENFSVESQLAPEGVASYLPLPRTKVGIYGTACMASGKATVKLFNSVELADVVAVIVLPDCATDMSLQRVKLLDLDAKECENAESGLLCVAARMNVVSLFQGRGFVRVPLGSFSPVLAIGGDALGARLDINASLKRIKVKADVKVLKVTIIFPSATGIDAKVIEKILKNLLKPSIDWDSIRRGKIVISSDQGKGGGEGPSPNTPPGPPDTTPANEVDKPGVGPPVNKPTPGSPGVGLAFSSGNRVIRIAKDRRLLVNDWPYLTDVIDRHGTRSWGSYEVRVTEQTAAAMMGRGRYLLPNASAFELPEGMFLLFCSNLPCEASHLVARRVEIVGIDSQRGELEKSVSVNFVSGKLSAESHITFVGALPRAAQLAASNGRASELFCTDYEPSDCLAALHRVQGDSQWRYFPPGQPAEDIVAADSLWGRAFQLLGSEKAGTVIAQSMYHDVAALSVIDNAQTLRVLLSPALRWLPPLRTRARPKTPEIPISTALLTVGSTLGPGYSVEPVESSVQTWRHAAPWRVPPPESPLTRVVAALPAPVANRKLTINAGAEGRRAVAEIVADASSSFIYSVRQRGKLCSAMTQSGTQLGATLNLWSQPADLNNAAKGRLKGGTDAPALLSTLATRLVTEPFVAPFLIDPLFLFYENGSCP